ncbi:uncharacterized protein [Thunnus thynnus]|uniref:uncharacterized protein n=1 Tax=Thunnus thynnus TaxID=8237 RepID=UPI0035289A0E
MLYILLRRRALFVETHTSLQHSGVGYLTKRNHPSKLGGFKVTSMGLPVYFFLLTLSAVSLGDANGAAPKPYVTSLHETEDWALLQCEVQGAFSKPKSHWEDSDGNILPAEEPHVIQRGSSYDVILNINVTKTGRYRCVATQEEINHQIYAETYVYIHEDKSYHGVGVWFLGVKYIMKCGKKGPPQGNDSHSSPSKQQLNPPI